MEQVKSALLQSRFIRRAWARYRSKGQLQSYLSRREHYESVAAARGLRYSPADSRERLVGRLAARGYKPPVKEVGDVHTFLWAPSISWHETLVPDLHHLGDVSRFDYAALGFARHDLVVGRRAAPGQRRRIATHTINELRRVNKRKAVDWVFIYGNGREVESTLPYQIAEEFGVPVVNMCLDDKHRWEGEWLGGQRTGQVDIAQAFDLTWTSSRVATQWYLCEDAIPLYMPEGFDTSRYAPILCRKDIDVSFVGAAYGFRPLLIGRLQDLGIAVTARGAGWPLGPAAEADVRKIFNRSKINLGMGGVGYDPAFTTLKGRDFDIPGSGGGLYLTSYNAELAECFRVGAEIACYGSENELVELIRYYLSHQEERERLAQEARQRALAEHRWLHRYIELLNMLGILERSGSV